MRNEVVIGATANNLSEQIQITEVRGECEVQPVLDGWRVPVEWQSRRGATQIRMVRRKRRGEPLEVLAPAPVEASTSRVSRVAPCTVAATPPTRMNSTRASTNA